MHQRIIHSPDVYHLPTLPHSEAELGVTRGASMWADRDPVNAEPSVGVSPRIGLHQLIRPLGINTREADALAGRRAVVAIAPLHTARYGSEARTRQGTGPLIDGRRVSRCAELPTCQVR